MAAPRPSFHPPYDIHLLRGQSINLTNLLEINSIAAAKFIDDPQNAKISYTFKTSFKPSIQLKITATIGNPTSRKPTCTIKLEPAAPTTSFLINSFLVYVEVTDKSNPTKPETAQTAIRIHVHKSIQKVWMTPNPLTVYQGVDGARCAIYARFNDGVVAEIGDIYRGDNEQIIDYAITKKVQITWKSTTSGLISVNGRITPGTRTGNHPLTIQVKYDTHTFSTTGEIQISDALTATQTKIQAELVATGHGPGFSKLTEVPNILFLAEGFVKEDQQAFSQLVDNYVSDLGRNKISSPFDLLKDSINFWKVFVPSRESGITYRGVLKVNEDTPEPGETAPIMRGGPVLIPTKPEKDDASTWSLENLLYFVDIPLETEASILPTQLRARWENTTRLTKDQLDILFAPPKPGMAGPVTDWIDGGTRRLPNAKDSAFGISVNDYTAMEQYGDYELINFDKRRVQRSFLDGFLGGLKDKDNNPIGSVFVMNTTNDQPGKDYDNIVFLLASTRGREQNENGYLFSGLKDSDYVTLKGTLADDQVSIAPVKIPDALPLIQKATLTHELAHSFGLGDEYGEPTQNEDYAGKPIDDKLVANWGYARYKSSPYYIDEYSNLQPKKDFERPRSDGQPGTEIDAYKIKWRYHRIQICSLITAVSVTGNDVQLTLKNPRAFFRHDDKVFLRKRRISRTQLRISDEELTVVADIVNPATLDPDFTKYYVRAQTILPADNKIIIQSEVESKQATIELGVGQTSFFKQGQRLDIQRKRVIDPIYTLTRTPPATAGQPDVITPALSPELTITSISSDGVTIVVQVVGSATLPTALTTLNAGEELLLYVGIGLSNNAATPQYKYAELITRPILDYLNTNAYPLNANEDHKEIIDTNDIQNSSLPKSLVPCCTKGKKQIVALYSGGKRSHGEIYHPTAQCMMLTSTTGEGKKKHYVELCAVCRYTLINMINPTKFEKFDIDYMNRKIYPT